MMLVVRAAQRIKDEANEEVKRYEEGEGEGMDRERFIIDSDKLELLKEKKIWR